MMFSILNTTRGILILLVVIGHSIIPLMTVDYFLYKFIWRFIYIFHMPAFFCISGYLFQANINKYNNPVKFVLKKAKLLIIPYVSISLIVNITINLLLPVLLNLNDSGLTSGHKIKDLSSTIYSVFLFDDNVCRHLWFILVLFLFFLITIFTKNIKLKIIAPISIGLYSCLFLVLPSYESHYLVSQSLKFFVFFVFGRVLFFSPNLFRGYRNVIYMVFFIGSFLQIYLWEDLNIIMFYIFPLINGLLGTIVILDIAKLVDVNFFMRKHFLKLSNYSYGIYLLHQPLVSGLSLLLYIKFNIPVISIIIFISIMGVLIPYIVIKFFIKKHSFLNLILLGSK